MDIRNGSSIDKHLDLLLEDCPNIVKMLSNYDFNNNPEYLELKTTLPAAINIDVFIATVQRWKEIQRMYKKKLRIYAYSYNDTVEKYFQRLLQDHEDILLTVIPGALKGKHNA